MGAGQSAPKGNIGLHVLRVAEGSPAADSQIEPYFDFVVGYNGTPTTADTDAFMDAVDECEQADKHMILQVWSSKREELRDVRIKPSKDWSSPSSKGKGSAVAEEDADPSLLGLSLRLCSPDGALEQVWHILDILEGSPAQAAGLVNFGDYVIGYPGGVLRGEGDFFNLVEEHTDRPLRLFVYNADFDVTREVVIVPNRDWGNGDSLLGCGVGYGLLHRIPKPQDRPEGEPLIEAPSAPQKRSPSSKAQNLPTALRAPVPRRSASLELPNDEEDDTDDGGVELIDTTINQTPTPTAKATSYSNRQQSKLQANGVTPLQNTGRRSPEGRQQAVQNGPPPSPSYKHNKRSNSVAEVLFEEEES